MATTPSPAILDIFFEAFEVPFTLKISKAFSISPPDSLRAAAQSLNPASQSFLNFLTSSKNSDKLREVTTFVFSPVIFVPLIFFCHKFFYTNEMSVAVAAGMAAVALVAA